MSTEADRNRPAERSSSPQRPDAEHVELGEEEIDKMKTEIFNLEKLMAEIQREVAAKRERLGQAKDSGSDRASRYDDLPPLEPGSALAISMAMAQRRVIVDGLTYLDDALTVEHFHYQETGHGLDPGSPTGLEPRSGRFQVFPRDSAQETAPDYNEQRESVSAAIDALTLSQEKEDPADNNSNLGER